MIFQAPSTGVSWNHIKCKNNDQTCLFQCINICWVPRKMFEHSACGFVFKQLPRDLANVNAWKNVWSLYLKHLWLSGNCHPRSHMMDHCSYGFRYSFLCKSLCLSICPLYISVVLFWINSSFIPDRVLCYFHRCLQILSYISLSDPWDG